MRISCKLENLGINQAPQVTDRWTKQCIDELGICHRNLHLKFQLSILNSSQENHVSPIALRTDG